MSTPSTKWLTSQDFVLRMTGFPVHLVDVLRLPESSAALEGRGTSRDELRWLFDKEVDASYGALQRVARHPEFLEAVLLSNQAGYQGIRGWVDGHHRRPTKARNSALAVASYLQRFTMKNDTASFFGPVRWGQFQGSENLMAERVDSKVQRFVFFTHWAARAVAQASRELPEVRRAVIPRRVPTVREANGLAHGVIPAQPVWQKVKPVRLSRQSRVLLRLIDGSRSVAELANASRTLDPDESCDIEALLEELAEAQTIVLGPEVPEGTERPLDDLYAHLLSLGCPSGFLDAIATLLQLRTQFEKAGLPQREQLLAEISSRFTALTGLPATRGAGKLYADRSILYEDCEADFRRLQVGGSIRADIEGLSPLWDFLWLFVEEDHRLTNERVNAWFERRWPAQTSVSFIDYCTAWIEDFETLRLDLDGAYEDWLIFNDRLLGEVGLQENDGPVRISLREAREVVDRYASRPITGAVANPDLIICGRSVEEINAGDYELVLGELHSDRDLLSHGAMSAIMPAATRQRVGRFAFDGYARACAPDEIPVDVVREHNRKTNVHLDIGLRYVEAQGRTRNDRFSRLQLADLAVERLAGRIRLRSVALDKYIRLTVARVPVGSDERYSPLRPFAFPRRDYVLPFRKERERIPEVRVGPVIIQREVRRLHLAKLGDRPNTKGWTVEGWEWMRQLQQRLGLANDVYAKVDGERKGMFISFDSYMLLAAFFRIWQRRGGWASFAACRPTREELWLEGASGRYSCELRMGLFRTTSESS